MQNKSKKIKLIKIFSSAVFIAAILFLLLFLFLNRNTGKNSGQNSAEQNGKLILGFSQIGSESAWRTRNTQSIFEAAIENDIQIIFDDAQQKQENQLKAIRSFIVYQVDVIAFVPIVEDGWDNVLTEAKEAGIPVILVDRQINADPSLYAGFLGEVTAQEKSAFTKCPAQKTLRLSATVQGASAKLLPPTVNSRLFILKMETSSVPAEKRLSKIL